MFPRDQPLSPTITRSEIKRIRPRHFPAHQNPMDPRPPWSQFSDLRQIISQIRRSFLHRMAISSCPQPWGPALEYAHQQVFNLTKYYSENKNSTSSLYPPSTDSNKPSIINPKIYYNQTSHNNSPLSTAYVTSSPYFYASPPTVPVNAIGKGSENTIQFG